MEYGTSPAGNIKTGGRYFRCNERYMCGKTVYVVRENSSKTCTISEQPRGWRWFLISKDMLMPAFIEPDDDMADIDILSVAKILGVS